MVSAFVQLRWLLWKNWVILKRRYIATPLEFLIPVLIPVILILIRQRVESYEVTEPKEWPACSEICEFPTAYGLRNIDSLAFYPNNSFTYMVMQKAIKNKYLKNRITKLKYDFTSEDEMLRFLEALNETSKSPNTDYYAAGIVFSKLEKMNENNIPTVVEYKIRMPATPRNRKTPVNELDPFTSDVNWRTTRVFPIPLSFGPREKKANCSSSPDYQQEGFTSLQCVVNSALFGLFNGSTNLDLDISAQRNPFPVWYHDAYVVVIQQNFGNILLLAFFCTILNAASDVTSERQDRLKETLRMMGVSSSVQWSAWLIRYFITSIIIALFSAIFYCVPTPGHPPVIPKSDPTLIFFFFLLSSMASISFALMISSFFATATSAAVASAIIYLLSYAPYQFIYYSYGSTSLLLKVVVMLDSTAAMAFGGMLIGDFEALGAGAQWHSFTSPVSIDDDLTIAVTFLMLVVDIFLYCAIAFYVETVKPGDFGVAQPFYFPLMPSFWFPSIKSSVTGFDPNAPREEAPIPQYANSSWFEKSDGVVSSLNPIVQIRDLTRKFSKGKTAVDSLSFDLFENQVTCLLGHNGSGKTTTMFMLTGFLAPTSGTAVINGHDIRKAAELTEIRQQLGLCPQHDVLFRQLTVTEHLQLFALLKGCPLDEIDAEVSESLASVNLQQKKDEYARDMSGGQKRRLSVAIALIGGSKVVILDEPTSGTLNRQI